MGSVTHTILDGGHVTISGPDGQGFSNMDGGASSYIVVDVAPGVYEFGSGRRQFGELVAAEIGIALSEEYSVQGGRLRWGGGMIYYGPDDRDEFRALGVWEGQSYSFMTTMYAGTSKDFVSII